MLTIYNSLAREKQVFVPIRPGKVGMYVCGMTVYDYCHIGHARVMVVFDMVVRWLRASGYDVVYVRNITDIDDKIIHRAMENQESIKALTDRFIDAMNEDAADLNVLPPTFAPKATDHVQGMIRMIEMLIKRGLAYHAENGDVYYDVSRFASYGRLSGKSLGDLRAGERVEIDTFKHDPFDFVLWKSAKPGEPSWPSPWGLGRPGWHIECSAMSEQHLGVQFDIHGGGQDLQFPHHENEIAQSEGAHGHPYVNYWMHNGFVRVDGEKMAKSLGNFFTIREVLAHYDPEVIRFFILQAHYRSPLNYSAENLDHARHALTRLYTVIRDVSASPEVDWNNSYAERFRLAMDDDFNTPEAFAVLFEMAHEANRSNSLEIAGQLKALSGLLGLLERPAHEFLQASAVPGRIEVSEIEGLIVERSVARTSRDFSRSDAIRDLLLQKGVLLEDSPEGTTWRWL
ncbi:MAG: cysteine--tRNA ligase [Pseudomonadota bacterium]|nr:cysteine--tRNA ligase [Pseudomonadota bacterium]